MSCLRCRSFFLRCLRSAVELRCEERGECAIAEDGRRQCRACRFKRCLRAGLNPKLVHSVRFLDGQVPDKQRRRLQANAKRLAALEWTVVADETKKLTKEFAGPLGFRSSFEVADKSDFRSVLRFLCAVEDFVAQFSENGYSPALPDCRWPSAPPRFDLQLNVAEALLVATRRLSLVWRADHWLALESLTPLWCRRIVYYADLISHVPEFRRLDAADQCRLGVDRLLSVSALLYAQQTVRNTEKKCLLMGGGTYVPLESEELAAFNPQGPVLALVETARIIYADLIEPLKMLAVSDEELLFLRMLAFLVPVPKLSPDARKAVREARRRYESLFVDFLVDRWGQPAAVQRMSALLAFLPTIEQIAAHGDAQMIKAIVFHEETIRGTLVHEFYTARTLRN
ncbi:Nuclear receptor [Aphelenchoides fujianensis]|nr:Nuclear receptor [Aphelenchoides fujianensis]